MYNDSFIEQFDRWPKGSSVQLCNCFWRNKINVSLGKDQGFDFCCKGRLSGCGLWAKCKNSYVFLMTELWNICNYKPFLDYWLLSFLICVNLSVNILISCLRLLCMKCLLVVGGIQCCDYCVGLCFICYASQSFESSWFSVCFSFVEFLTSCLQTVQPKP